MTSAEPTPQKQSLSKQPSSGALHQPHSLCLHCLGLMYSAWSQGENPQKGLLWQGPRVRWDK